MSGCPLHGPNVPRDRGHCLPCVGIASEIATSFKARLDAIHDQTATLRAELRRLDRERAVLLRAAMLLTPEGTP